MWGLVSGELKSSLCVSWDVGTGSYWKFSFHHMALVCSLSEDKQRSEKEKTAGSLHAKTTN